MDGPLSDRRYRRVGAYAQSKLANLLFTSELRLWQESERLTGVGYALSPARS